MFYYLCETRMIENHLSKLKLWILQFKTQELTKIGPGKNRVDGMDLKNKLQDFYVIIWTNYNKLTTDRNVCCVCLNGTKNLNEMVRLKQFY